MGVGGINGGIGGRNEGRVACGCDWLTGERGDVKVVQ